MAVTVKDIAEYCHVSRGTVDRVLNNNGRVSPATRKLVEQAIRDLNYHPDPAGKSLAARKKHFTIGIVLCSIGIEFFDDVIRGMNAAHREFSGYNISMRMETSKGYSVDWQLKTIDRIAGGINLLILNPINDPAIAERLNQLIDSGIPVITVNNDVENCRRICFIGTNYQRSGATACGMAALIAGEDARVGIAVGSSQILGHNDRIRGFENDARLRYPRLDLQGVCLTADDDDIAYQAMTRFLKEHPALNCLYIASSGGTRGICRAVSDLKLHPYIIASDRTPAVTEGMRSGIIQATICQQPYSQGYQAFYQAIMLLIRGIRPPHDTILTINEIRIAENLDWNLNDTI